jgi:hypothetical protein
VIAQLLPTWLGVTLIVVLLAIAAVALVSIVYEVVRALYDRFA